MSLVITEKRDGYAIITLNRPDEMNALSRALRGDIIAAFEDCQADENIRVLILTGNGRAFCAGMDLKELGSSDFDDSADEVGNEMQVAVAALRSVILSFVITL